MKTAYYDKKPAIFEAVGDGAFIYRWGLEEVEANTVSTEQGAQETARTQWKCNEVMIWATVTREKLTAAVLGVIWDSDYEAKLINDYNGAKEGVFGEDAQKYIDRYTAFLMERKAVKEQIAADCSTFNIS